MAASGLVIFFISVIFPFYLRNKFLFKLFDIRRDIAVDDIKTKNLKNRISKMNDRLGEIKKCEDEDGKEEVLVEWEADADELEKDQDELAALVEERRCELSKIDILSDTLKIIRLSSLLGIFVGLSLTLSGFFLWYIRLQTFVDRAMLTGVNP